MTPMSNSHRKMKRAKHTGLAASPRGVTRGEATPGTSHLHRASPEFYYRAVPYEVKTEVKEEANSLQRNDEDLLKEIFKVQYEQLQTMTSSQEQLATAVTLSQPEVQWRSNQVQNVHHCVRCAHTDKSSNRRR